MPTNRTKAKTRRPNVKIRAAVRSERVQEVLLELAYRLHATRPVVIAPRPTGSVA